MTICDMVPKLDKCCCCVNLRLGGLILGAFYVVFSILAVAGGFTLISDLNNADPNYNRDLISEIINIVIAFIELGLHIFLLLGICTNRHHWLLPYLWVRGILFILYFVSIVLLFFVAWWSGLVLFLSLCISVYFWMCIQSLYQEMKGRA